MSSIFAKTQFFFVILLGWSLPILAVVLFGILCAYQPMLLVGCFVTFLIVATVVGLAVALMYRRHHTTTHSAH